MAIAAPPQRIIRDAAIGAVLEKFETAGRSGALHWNRFLRQVHAAAQLPGSLARVVSSGPGGTLPELLNLFVAASRKLDRDFTQALIGAYLTPIDCEDLRSVSSHVARGVRLEARAAAAPIESAAAVLTPMWLAVAGCWDDYAAMIPLVRDSARLIAVSKEAGLRRKSAVDRLRAARAEALWRGCACAELLSLLEGFRRMESVFAELRDAQRGLLSFSLKYS